MAKPKSILEKFSDTVKGLADSASQALKAEEPARVDETGAAYMPFAAEGLVSDPLLPPPVAAQPMRRKRRAAKRTAARDGAKMARKSRKSANKPAARRSRETAKRSVAASSKRVAKIAKRKGGAGKPGKRGRQS